MTDWYYWINEPIFLNNGVYTIVKRKEGIRRFCLEGLIPFLQKYGYRIYYSDAAFVKHMLHLLFAIQNGKKVLSFPVDYPHYTDHKSQFDDLLDGYAWEEFWNHWGKLQDFQEDAYASRFRFQLPLFLWSWLDFDYSSTIQKLERELNQTEDEDFSKGRDDPYLQETSKRDYQDRHWH